MHCSRIGLVLIDHAPEHYDAGLRFWAVSRASGPATDGEYASVGEIGTVSLGTQRLQEGPSRIHLDIETDDVAAEVARLEGLGARVVQRHDTYVVMADPGDLVLCVVPVQTGDRFVEDALEWR